jgi:hypothetical protein
LSPKFRNLCISSILLCASGLQAATYYVSVGGNDLNSGSAAAPFQTLSKAVSAAQYPGDTVIVMNGTYGNQGAVAPNYVVSLNYSGAPGNPITIMAQNRGQAILDSGNTSTSTTCNGASAYFNLNNQAFVVIQGFVIQHACDAGIQSNAGEHDITLRWNTIQYIANREVTDQYGRDGIYLNGNEYNFTFDGNVFHDIGRTGGVSQVHFDHGIYAAATGLTIINNVFYNMTSGFSIQIDGGSNWLIANNTFAFGDTGDGEAGQIMFWNPISNIAVENNIFYQPNTSALTEYAATLNGCTFTDNLIYGVSSVMNGSTTGMTIGTNQIGVNPLFVNATTSPYNFALSAGSPAIGAGLSLPLVTDDLTGNTRPAAPSLGAYEGTGAGATAPSGGTGTSGTSGTGTSGSTSGTGTSGSSGSSGTPPPPTVNPTGPVITAVFVSGTGSNLYVNWTTSTPATSDVQFGPGNYLSNSGTSSTLVTMHSAALTGLQAYTTYQYRVISQDAYGNVTTYTAGFTTSGF